MYHRRQQRKHSITSQSQHTCNVKTCGETFGSIASLNRHKANSDHTARALIRKPKKAKKNPPKRQRTIADVLKQCRTRAMKQGTAREEDPCDAEECIIGTPTEDSRWVECEECEDWHHDICAGLQHKSADELADTKFICTSRHKRVEQLRVNYV